MTAFVKKLNYGFDLVRLWLVLVPLRIAGFVMLVSGIAAFVSNSGAVISESAPAGGVVVDKVERPIPGQELKIYSVVVTPDDAPAARASYIVDRKRWDTIAIGDRWASPARPGSGSKSGNRLPENGVQSMITGLLMLAAASFIRRRIQTMREKYNSAEGLDIKGSLDELLQAAAKMKAKASPASKSTPAAKKSTPTPRAAPVRRTSTVTRAGWL